MGGNVVIQGKTSPEEGENVKEVLVAEDGSIVNITFTGHLIQDGRVYTGSHIFTSVANNAFIDILMVTGSKIAFVGVSISAVGDFQGTVYEDATVSANGTPLVSVNFNRPLSDELPTPLTEAFLDPTITDNGLVLTDSLIIGGEKKDAVASSGERLGVQKSDTLYLFRFQNQSGQSAKGTIGWTIGE